MKNNKNLILAICICMSMTEIVMASRGRAVESKPVESKTSFTPKAESQMNQPSTAQRYAMQARDAIAQKTGIANQGIIDSMAGTKRMSLSPTAFTSAPMVEPARRINQNETGVELTNMGKKSSSENFDFLTEWEHWGNNKNESNIITQATPSLVETYNPLFFKQSTEHLGIKDTPSIIEKSNPSFLQKTTDNINTWIGETASAYSRNQATAKIAADRSSLASQNAQRPKNRINIDNPKYQSFLKQILYTDLFKNLTTSKTQSLSNGYTAKSQIVTDIINKILLVDMQIPESVLTSPRFANQKLQQIKTSFANQAQKISENTKITLKEKQTQINQALTNLYQNLTTFVRQIGIKAPESSTVLSETMNPYEEDSTFELSPIRPKQKKEPIEKSPENLKRMEDVNEMTSAENAALKAKPLRPMQQADLIMQAMLKTNSQSLQTGDQKLAWATIAFKARNEPTDKMNAFILNELKSNKAFDSFDIYDPTDLTIVSYAASKPLKLVPNTSTIGQSTAASA